MKHARPMPWLMLLVLAGAALTGVARRQDGPETPAEPPALIVGRSGVVNLQQRLEALDPSRPMDYFMLAEEVAYELPFADGQELARQLLVLAYELDRNNPPRRPGFGRSACLALADLSTRPLERRWLLAMASLEAGGPGSGIDWRIDEELSLGSDTGPYDMAVAFGWYRSEEFRRARELLARNDAVALLRRAGFDKEEAELVVQRFRAELEARPTCPQCRNERVVRKPGDGRPTLDLCTMCRGNPGPRLNADAFIQTLRMEALLLRASPRSWAAQSMIDRGQPLRDVDPGELAAFFKVDPARSRWLGPESVDASVLPEDRWTKGRWVTPDEAAGIPPAAAPGPGT